MKPFCGLAVENGTSCLHSHLFRSSKPLGWCLQQAISWGWTRLGGIGWHPGGIEVKPFCGLAVETGASCLHSHLIASSKPLDWCPQQAISWGWTRLGGIGWHPGGIEVKPFCGLAVETGASCLHSHLFRSSKPLSWCQQQAISWGWAAPGGIGWHPGGIEVKPFCGLAVENGTSCLHSHLFRSSKPLSWCQQQAISWGWAAPGGIGWHPGGIEVKPFCGLAVETGASCLHSHLFRSSKPLSWCLQQAVSWGWAATGGIGWHPGGIEVKLFCGLAVENGTSSFHSHLFRSSKPLS